MEQDQLDEMEQMLKENNSILRGMRQSARVKGFFKFLFWAAIIAGIYFAWQAYVQPVANQASQTYQSAQGQVQSVQNQLQSTQRSLQGVQQAASSTQSFFGGIMKNFGF